MPEQPLFAEPTPERSFPTTAVAIAAVAIVLLVGLFVGLGMRSKPVADPHAMQPLAAYAASLKITDIAMSESTSISGGKSTYIDGRITNAGAATVTGVTVQAVFASDGGPAQIETVPLTLIRTREPYVDTQPVAAAPLAPGATAEFRLIFEGVGDAWNQQVPEIRVVQTVQR
jgi:hypothetical protein